MEQLFVRPIPWWKRATDIVGSLAAIIGLSPLMLAIAIAIKLSAPGPVLFNQIRGGQGGKPFKVFKFRTMVVNAEGMKKDLLKHNEREGPAFKMRDDPRVTGVGRFLRKASLDELPQFFNVLKGDMSLVGPRPLPYEESLQYDLWHRIRMEVKPGITCIWQISSRDESCFHHWVRQDIQYIRNMSFWYDLKLLIKTVPAVVSRKGAH